MKTRSSGSVSWVESIKIRLLVYRLVSRFAHMLKCVIDDTNQLKRGGEELVDTSICLSIYAVLVSSPDSFKSLFGRKHTGFVFSFLSSSQQTMVLSLHSKTVLTPAEKKLVENTEDSHKASGDTFFTCISYILTAFCNQVHYIQKGRRSLSIDIVCLEVYFHSNTDDQWW